MLCALSVDTPYLSVKQEFTLSGTRPGAPVVSAFAVLEYLGTRGMRKVVEGCMKNTWRLIDGMETFGYPQGRHPRGKCGDIRRKNSATAVACLVDEERTYAHYLYAPCPWRHYRGIFKRYW